MSRSVSLTLVTALATALASGSPARASTLRLFGYGGRSPGVAATGVATCDGFDSVYLNPAGLADAPRRRLTLGGLVGAFELELDGDDAGVDTATGTLFGAVLPMPLGGALRDRVGLGIGLYIPTGTYNRAHAELPGTPIYALLDSTSQVVALQVATGVRIGRNWRVGAGVIALAALRGRIFVDSDAAGRFATRSEQRLVTQFAPVVGARRHWPRRGLAAGVTFRGPSRSDYDVRVGNDLSDELPLTLPELVIAGAAQYDPLTVAAEVAARPRWAGGRRRALLLALQLAYERWSAYPPPTLPTIAGAPPQEPPDFHDTVVPRVAAEWNAKALGGELSLRGGYAFAMSPAPEMVGRQSLLDNHRHVLSAGLGAAWPRSALPIHADLWFQTHLLVPRQHTKDPDRFEPDAPPPFDEIDTGGAVLAGGVTVGIDL
jgi:hypothetical protein